MATGPLADAGWEELPGAEAPEELLLLAAFTHWLATQDS